MKKALLLVLLLGAAALADADTPDRYDPEAALQLSQQAIGRSLGDYAFTDELGQPVNLRRDYAGKPLVIKGQSASSLLRIHENKPARAVTEIVAVPELAHPLAVEGIPERGVCLRDGRRAD